MIQIKNIKKTYTSNNISVDALKNINLNIERGDFYGIIGLSGAGKSTLIRLLNRLEEPTSGEIIVDKKDILGFNNSELQEYRKKTGMIFQHFNLMNSRSVGGNIAFALEVANYPKEKIKPRIIELLKLVELEDKIDSYPAQLSGGQKQRVAIARALANHPKVLLSDEATSALDPKTTKNILNLLKDIQKKLNLTIILITHQMEVIRDSCNKVAVLDGGEVIEEGKVTSIFSNPQTVITQEFIKHLIPEEETEVEFSQKEGRKIIKISYIGEVIDKPVISQLIRKFDVDISILAGSINKLVTNSVGHLILELNGNMEKQLKSIEWLKQNKLGIEVLYNG